MRSKYILVAVVLVSLLAVAVVYAGSLEPTGAPTASSGQMYTLEQIYGRISDGTAATKMTTFTEPTSGPTAGTMHTLDEIYDLVAQRAPVRRTGQTTSYAVGDDGDWHLHKGVEWPQPRFTANVDNNGDGDCTDGGETCDGTVTDNLTGLIWLRNANCAFYQCTWQEALNNVTELNTFGEMGGGVYDCDDTSNAGSHQTDWRLPNVNELLSLVHWGFSGPAVPNTAGLGKWADGDPFTGVQSDDYWSSTTIANSTNYAWSVNLGTGKVNSSVNVKASADFYVWPVRGGQ